jgi:hypothetical protein
VPVTVLVIKDYPRSLEMSRQMTLWYLGLGPFLLIATAASLWQLARNRRRLPIALLVATSILLLRFAWQNEWLPLHRDGHRRGGAGLPTSALP